MTELVPYKPAGDVDLEAWARAGVAAAALADALARTMFVPKHFQGKPADCAAAILAGAEVGLSPVQALRSMYVIAGTPAMYARTMVALTQRHGHKVWTEKETPTEVVVCGQRHGSERVEKVRFTFDQARAAGYTNNIKYRTDPQSMLYARAASIVCRRIAADALLGIPFSAEELEDDAAPRPDTVTVSRLTLQPEDAAKPVQDQEDGISSAQTQKLHALFRRAGISDRSERLEYAAAVVGRQLTSSKELTRSEASAVIDQLETGQGDEQPWVEPQEEGLEPQ
jgi:hypothetical protein